MNRDTSKHRGKLNLRDSREEITPSFWIRRYADGRSSRATPEKRIVEYLQKSLACLRPALPADLGSGGSLVSSTKGAQPTILVSVTGRSLEANNNKLLRTNVPITGLDLDYFPPLDTSGSLPRVSNNGCASYGRVGFRLPERRLRCRKP